MAEEFVDSPMEFNGIWDGSGNDPVASKCLELLSCFGHGSGQFYAVDVAAIPAEQQKVGPLDYTKGVEFVDLATTRWLEGALQDASLGDSVASAPRMLQAVRMERGEACLELRRAASGVAAAVILDDRAGPELDALERSKANAELRGGH